MLERYNKILELVTTHEKVEVASLASVLKVSQVTIRKDLNHLESEGMIIRQHGYAKINNSDDMNVRLALHYDRKQKIAEHVASIVSDGETIMIESGSCCAMVAQMIAKTKNNVTIITNSAFIANYIRKYDNIEIILLGGEYQKSSQAMVGPLTITCAKMFHVSKFFIGIDGFTMEQGFMGNDYLRSEMVRHMVLQAQETIIVSESNKFGQNGMIDMLETKQVDVVVTDNHISETYASYLKEQGITVHQASIDNK